MNRLLAWLTVNDVATGSSAAYPELRPLDLDLHADAVFDLARSVAGETRGWEIVAQSAQDRRIEVEAKTRTLQFVDDVSVWVEGRPGGGSRLLMRSHSRLGRGDFGTNARRIRAFLDLVERRARAPADASTSAPRG